MAFRLLVAAPMRYLGLLFALSLFATPASARKHQKHAAPQRSAAPVAEAEPAPPPAETRHAAPPASQVAQADDEEVPGKRHKK
jgi:hypothetical protein